MNEAMEKLLKDIFWNLNHHTNKRDEVLEQLKAMKNISVEVEVLIDENLEMIKAKTWTL